MYKNRFRQGFTLIELLIVIAIIGILSSVVLASLNTARFRGNDAAIQSDLFAIRTQAEIFYGGNNSYGISANACLGVAGSLFVEPTIAKAIASADTANGSNAPVVCNSDQSAYAIAARLSSDSTKDWCVDSTGSSLKIAASPGLGAATVCPAN